MDYTALAAYFVALVVYAASPGPIMAVLVARSLGKDWKGKLSPVLYAAAIGLSFIQPWMAGSLYVFVALMWLVPDKRIERVVQE